MPNYLIQHLGVGRFRKGQIITEEDLTSEEGVDLKRLLRLRAIAPTNAEPTEVVDTATQDAAGNYVDHHGSDRPDIAGLVESEQVTLADAEDRLAAAEDTSSPEEAVPDADETTASVRRPSARPKARRSQ